MPVPTTKGYNKAVLKFATLILCLPLCASSQAEEDRQSQRMYDIEHADLSKSFDLRLSSFGNRSFDADRSQAKTKSFFFWQKTEAKTFEAEEFQGSKSTWFGGLRFFTKSATVKGRNEIPYLDRPFATKTVPVTTATAAEKTAATRALPGGDRTYLGPEISKMKRPMDPTRPPDGWQGNLSEVKTLEDVRALLNKNK